MEADEAKEDRDDRISFNGENNILGEFVLLIIVLQIIFLILCLENV